MQLLSVLNNKFKVSFNPSKYDIAIGGLFKLVSSEQNKVIAQAISIETSVSGEYITTLRALFTEKNSAWSNWSGNIPTKNCIIKQVSKEVFQSLISNNDGKIIQIGYIPTYGIGFGINLPQLKNLFVIYDNLQDKQDFVQNLQAEFAAKNEKLVIFDFKNEFDCPNKITASRDFKIPLNITNLNNIYQKNMQNASAETKAVVEDVIFQIKDYLKSIDREFIPFSSFKSVIDDESTHTAELLLFKNALAQYSEVNLFADSFEEIGSINDLLMQNLISVIDLSKINTNWQKEYLEFALNNLEDVNILLELDENYFDEGIKQLILHKKQDIKTLAMVGYSSPLSKQAINAAQNLVLFSINDTSDAPALFSDYLKSLYSKEFIFCGEQTKNIPVIGNTNDDTIKIPIREEDLLYEEEPNVDLIDEEEEPDFIYKEENVEDILSEIKAISSPLETEIDDSRLSNLNLPSYNEETTIEPVDELKELQNEFQQANQTLSSSTGQIITQTENTIEPQQFETEFDNADYEILDYQEFKGEEETEDLFTEELLRDVDKLYVATPGVSQKKPAEEEGSIPIYSIPNESSTPSSSDYAEGDSVSHPKYGSGTVQKVISYGDKKLLSIQFENVGRRLLDPNLAELQKA